MKRSLVVIVTMLVAAQDVLAQGCSVCTKVANGQGATTAQGLNNGILYLAAMPLGILGTIGFIWWKHNKNN